MNTEISGTVTQDSKNSALLMWIGTLFLWFIPSLYFYLSNKDDAYVQAHAKEALNWSITLLMGGILGLSTIFVLIGLFILPAIAAMHVVFCIWGAAASFRGKPFRIPSVIRLVQ